MELMSLKSWSFESKQNWPNVGRLTKKLEMKVEMLPPPITEAHRLPKEHYEQWLQL
jgi:hypothetical protein